MFLPLGMARNVDVRLVFGDEDIKRLLLGDLAGDLAGE